MEKGEFLKKVLQKAVPIPDGTPRMVRCRIKKHRWVVNSRLQFRKMSIEKLKIIIAN